MANSQNQHLQSSWWQDYVKMLQAAHPTNIQMQMLATKPNTALGLAAGNFLGALLGHELYPKQENDSTMGVNEETTQALANNMANNVTNNIIAENPNSEFSQMALEQNPVDTSDMTFGMDLQNLDSNPTQDYLSKIDTQNNLNDKLKKITAEVFGY